MFGIQENRALINLVKVPTPAPAKKKKTALDFWVFKNIFWKDFKLNVVIVCLIHSTLNGMKKCPR